MRKNSSGSVTLIVKTGYAMKLAVTEVSSTSGSWPKIQDSFVTTFQIKILVLTNSGLFRPCNPITKVIFGQVHDFLHFHNFSSFVLTKQCCRKKLVKWEYYTFILAFFRIFWLKENKVKPQHCIWRLSFLDHIHPETQDFYLFYKYRHQITGNLGNFL